MAEMILGQKGIKLIQSFEKFESKLYDTDGGGHCTVGWGHLVHKGKCDGRENEKVFSKGITPEKGNHLFDGDVTLAVKAVNKHVNVPITQNQFDALVSFTYNAGRGSLTKMLNGCKNKEGKVDLTKVTGHMKAYIHSNKKISKGLVHRRQAETELFSKK